MRISVAHEQQCFRPNFDSCVQTSLQSFVSRSPQAVSSSKLKLLQGPMRLMDEGYKRYGEVFTVPVAHKKMTFLIGPPVSEHFFKASDDELSQKEVCLEWRRCL